MINSVPLVSVVVCTYNSRKIIEPCLRSLSRQTHPRIQMIVVDAGSTDDTLSICKTICPTVDILVDKDNLGYCYAENLGILASRGEFVVMLNSDAWLEADCIERMLETASQDPSVAAVAPKIYLPRYNMRLDSAGTLLGKDLSAMNRGHMDFDSKKYSELAEVFGVSDAAALYRKDTLEKIGGFDQLFIAYQEETDVCLRLRMMGYRILFNPKAIAYHLYSATVGEISYKKILLSERNVWWNLIVNCPANLVPYCAANLFLRYLKLAKLILVSPGTRPFRARSDLGWREIFKLLFQALRSTVSNQTYLRSRRKHTQSQIRVINSAKIVEMTQKFGYDIFDWFSKTSSITKGSGP